MCSGTAESSFVHRAASLLLYMACQRTHDFVSTYVVKNIKNHGAIHLEEEIENLSGRTLLHHIDKLSVYQPDCMGMSTSVRLYVYASMIADGQFSLLDLSVCNECFTPGALTHSF